MKQTQATQRATGTSHLQSAKVINLLNSTNLFSFLYHVQQWKLQYTLFQNGYNFIILLNSCKLALDASIPLRNSFEF